MFAWLRNPPVLSSMGLPYEKSANAWFRMFASGAVDCSAAVAATYSFSASNGVKVGVSSAAFVLGAVTRNFTTKKVWKYKQATAFEESDLASNNQMVLLPSGKQILSSEYELEKAKVCDILLSSAEGFNIGLWTSFALASAFDNNNPLLFLLITAIATYGGSTVGYLTEKSLELSAEQRALLLEPDIEERRPFAGIA